MDLKTRMGIILEEVTIDGYVRQGEEKGRTEGYHAGTGLALQWALYELLHHRFGRVPDAVRHYITYVEDEGRLKKAFRQALDLKDIRDLCI